MKPATSLLMKHLKSLVPFCGLIEIHEQSECVGIPVVNGGNAWRHSSSVGNMNILMQLQKLCNCREKNLIGCSFGYVALLYSEGGLLDGPRPEGEKDCQWSLWGAEQEESRSGYEEEEESTQCRLHIDLF